MKNLKKVAAFGLAAAMSVSMGVSAFADTYTPNTPENTTGNYTAPSDTVQENIKLSNVDFMNANEQYTVVLFKVETSTDGTVDLTSLNRSLAANDLFYINQGDKTEAFWTTSGMGPKGDKLEDGTYILRIGGESLTQVYEIPIVVKGKTILYGDVNRDGKITNADKITLARYLAKWAGYNESKVDLEAADVTLDGKITNADKLTIARYLAKWVGYETLPRNK